MSIFFDWYIKKRRKTDPYYLRTWQGSIVGLMLLYVKLFNRYTLAISELKKNNLQLDLGPSDCENCIHYLTSPGYDLCISQLQAHPAGCCLWGYEQGIDDDALGERLFREVSLNKYCHLYKRSKWDEDFPHANIIASQFSCYYCHADD